MMPVFYYIHVLYYQLPVQNLYLRRHIFSILKIMVDYLHNYSRTVTLEPKMILLYLKPANHFIQLTGKPGNKIDMCFFLQPG